MSSSSVQKIHALIHVQKYNNSRKCNVCGEEQPAGFSWVMITCVCGVNDFSLKINCKEKFFFTIKPHNKNIFIHSV